MIRLHTLFVLLLALSGAATACDGAPPEDASVPDPVAGTPDDVEPLPSVSVGRLEIRDLAVAEPVTEEGTALFFTIHNPADEGDSLLEIEVDGVARTSLHVSVNQDGVVSMRPVETVVVPPRGDVPLRPGGLHGMLEGIEAPWATGDTVQVLLHFEGAGEVRAPALVVPYAELDRRLPRG